MTNSQEQPNESTPSPDFSDELIAKLAVTPYEEALHKLRGAFDMPQNVSVENVGVLYEEVRTRAFPFWPQYYGRSAIRFLAFSAYETGDLTTVISAHDWAEQQPRWSFRHRLGKEIVRHCELSDANSKSDSLQSP